MKPTGYVRTDHRGTQGIRWEGGVPVLSGRDGRLVEHDTVLCCHCQAVLKLNTPGNAYGFCTRCSRYHCPTEACEVCTPFMRAIDRAEDREYHRQQFARAAGLEG